MKHHQPCRGRDGAGAIRWTEKPIARITLRPTPLSSPSIRASSYEEPDLRAKENPGPSAVRAWPKGSGLVSLGNAAWKTAATWISTSSPKCGLVSAEAEAGLAFGEFGCGHFEPWRLQRHRWPRAMQGRGGAKLSVQNALHRCADLEIQRPRPAAGSFIVLAAPANNPRWAVENLWRHFKAA